MANTGKRASAVKTRRSGLSIGGLVVVVVVLLVVAMMAANFFHMFDSTDGTEEEAVSAAGSAAEVPLDGNVSAQADTEDDASAAAVVKEPEEEPVTDLGIIVCLDPGHGGNDPGCNTDERLEKDDTLALALATRDDMEAAGITVVMTREDDTYVSLDDRCYIANQAGADYFISIHRNYASGVANGVEVWKSTNASDASVYLADAVSAGLEAVGVSRNRGVHTGSQSSEYEDYQVLRETSMPGVLIEMGFIENADDNWYLDTYLEEYAQALTQAVLDTVEASQEGFDGDSSAEAE
ncbi:MAG: N-acetylmuramoyl-L-alanine amidase [Clostridiales bacterium]|nr:N-acetylmuramoyl-L-alanine amidase [Clostridiales bacterium]